MATPFRTFARRPLAAVALALAGTLGCHVEDSHEVHTAAVKLPTTFVAVAVEGDGAIAFIDAASGKLVHTSPLAADHAAHDAAATVAVHNVQTAPDGATVWATVMPAPAGDHGGHGAAAGPDELVGVSSATGAIVARIELGLGLHAAHVVVRGDTAWVSAYAKDALIEVDLVGKKVRRQVDLPKGTAPHGIRLLPDGSAIAVAGMGDGSLHLVATASGAVTSVDLPGRAVQVAVTPDGQRVFATVYDSKQVARLDVASKAVALFDLATGTAGPIQVYPAPDGASLWVADQGMVGGDPAGSQLIQLDASTGVVLRAVTVDPAPHGVVVSADGAVVWATTQTKGTVQAVDAKTGAILHTIAVGKSPNGITFRHPGGAMP